MTIYNNLIVFPEGDEQEISHTLRINQLVDLNGNPVSLPLSSPKTIIYKVSRKSTQEKIGEVNTYFFLEQLTRLELESYSR